MAYVSYDRTSAVHATTIPHRRIAWGRLFALAVAVSLWAGIVATARALL